MYLQVENNFYLEIIPASGEIVYKYKKFNKELDMKNWLLDSGFKTHTKQENSECFFCPVTGDFVIWNF